MLKFYLVKLGRLHMNSRTERGRQHARECAEIARSSSDLHVQRSFLELEKQWLALAENAEESLPRRWINSWMPRGVSRRGNDSA